MIYFNSTETSASLSLYQASIPALLGLFLPFLIDKISDSFDIYCVVAGLCSFFGMSGVSLDAFFLFVILTCEKENFYVALLSCFLFILLGNVH